RQLITLAGTAAIGTAALPSHSVPATQRARWRPDGVGSLARIGVLTPDFDPVPESEMWAMAPQGVSIHPARVAWNRDPRAFAEPPNVDNAAEQLAGLTPRAILYAFTSSSYALWCRSRRPAAGTTREASRRDSGNSHQPGSYGGTSLPGRAPCGGDSSAMV